MGWHKPPSAPILVYAARDTSTCRRFDGMSQKRTSVMRRRPGAAPKREMVPTEVLESMVGVLAAALEMRDDETGEHAKRVTQLGLELAHVVAPELAADPELRYGFLLHDIGKI